MPLPSVCRSQVAPSLVVLTTAAVIALGVAIPAYRLGKAFEDEHHFVRPARRPGEVDGFLSYCGDYATKSAEANDVIFLGDSNCRYGIQTKQFEQLSGLSAFNLGMFGMYGSEMNLLLLESYLKHHPTPRAVVLCVAPRELASAHYRDQRTDDEFRAYRDAAIQRFRWCYGIAGEYPRPAHAHPIRHFVSQGMFVMLSVLFGDKEYYSNRPMSFKLGTFTYTSLRDYFLEHRGFCSTGSDRLSPTARRNLASGLLLPGKDATADDPFPVSPEFDAGVRQLARLAADHGVPLVIRLAPELTAETAEHFDRINAWFERLETECPNVVCDRPEVLIYGPECFADVHHHLNLRGVEEFTALVAARVSELLGSSSNPKTTTAIPNSMDSMADAEPE